MVEDKVKIENFNGQNYVFWKMQMEGMLYQKNLYLPINGLKPPDMDQAKWSVLDRKALGLVRLCLVPSIASNIAKERTIAYPFRALENMHEKFSAMKKVLKKLFNLKMSQSSVMAEHINELNIVTNQLKSMNIVFDDEIIILVLLSSLLESWNGLVVAVNNSSGSGKIKLEDVVSLILGEKTTRRALGEDVGSGSALSTEERGRSSYKGCNKKGKGISVSGNRGRSKSYGRDDG